MSKHKLYVANTTTWLIDQLENNTTVITEDQVLEWMTQAVNVSARDLYEEVKTVKDALEIDERSPNRCTTDKAVSSKYLLDLLTQSQKQRKQQKIQFVADTSTAFPRPYNEQLQTLLTRVAKIEQLLKIKPAVTTPTIGTPTKPTVKAAGDSTPQKVKKATTSATKNKNDPDYNPTHDEENSSQDDDYNPKQVKKPNTQQIQRSKTLTPLTSKNKAIKVCAFNIANFGETKFKKDDILNYIIRILYRYDLIVVQEIRSKAFDVVNYTVQELNTYCQNIGSAKRYKAERSNFVGNEHRQEQYGYFYNTRKLKIDEFKQFEDENDVFMYEPAFANFKIKRTGKEFTIVGVHIQKDNVVNELNNLVKLYDMIAEEFGTNNVVFTGDFNAEGSYLSKKKSQNVNLFGDPRFKSLIGSEVDTTVSKTDYAYDRIFVAGDMFRKLNEDDGKVFRFDKEFGLTRAEAFKVSDHYPIEFIIE